MRRELVVAFALVASLLTVTAVPVSAADSGGVVVSTHTTDTDFNDATLTNMTVVGSGTSAAVDIGSDVPDNDDGGLSYYDFNSNDANDQWGSNDGTVSGATYVSDGGPQNDGAYSFDGSNDHIDLGTSFTYDDTGTLTAWVNLDSTSSSNKYIFSNAGQPQRLYVLYQNSELELAFGETGVNTGHTPTTGNWEHVSLTWDSGSYVVYVNGTEVDSGSYTGSVAASDEVIGSFDGTKEYLPGDVDELRIYDTVLTGSDISDIYNATKSGGSGLRALPAEYLNNHSATNTVGGFSNISTAGNVSITATWRGDSNGDGSYDTLLNQTSGITSAANHSFTWSEFAGDDVRLNLTVESTGTNETFVLENEGVEAVGAEPTVDNASASPTGTLTTATPTLSIDVNDSDFPDAQGDSVDVEFFVDGNSQGTETLTANGTAGLEVGSLSGGDHTWHVVANDTYGHSVTSQTFDITTPANITIRNESDPHAIIDSVTVEAIIAGTGQTVDVQNTTDGNISLAGLPTEEEYIFVLEADGFHTRTVIVEDVFEQDDVFMLNTSLTSIENTFVLDDQTGQFEGDNVTLIIQRPINRSVYDSNAPEEFQWTDIAGDRTGAAEEFTVDLEKEKRFRIIVDNNEGDRRVLGEYQAETAGSVTLNIGELTFDIGADGATYEYDASFTSSNIKFNYTDPDDTTSSLTVKIFESGNASNEIYNQTHTDLGTLSVTQALSGDEENETWVVEFSGTRDGESIEGSVVVGASDLSPGVPLDDAWKTRIAFSLLLVLTGLTAGGINAETGTVVAALSGGVLWWSGWLPAEIGGGVVALALFVAAALTLSTRGGEEIQ